jgi:hypothetical protein
LVVFDAAEAFCREWSDRRQGSYGSRQMVEYSEKEKASSR